MKHPVQESLDCSSVGVFLLLSLFANPGVGQLRIKMSTKGKMEGCYCHEITKFSGFFGDGRKITQRFCIVALSVRNSQ